jgi:hypothetical protein
LKRGIAWSLGFVTFAGAFATASLAPGHAAAQGLAANDPQMHQLFTTAGYSAAFGAAMGAALLPFLPSPGLDSLRYIAAGASVGFFVGSGVALYRMNSATHSQDSFEIQEGDVDDTESYGWKDSNCQVIEQCESLRQPIHREPMPQGSLIVGNGGHFEFSVPAFAAGPKFALVSLIDVRF